MYMFLRPRRPLTTSKFKRHSIQIRIFLPNGYYHVKIYILILERNFLLNLAKYTDEQFRLTRFLRIGEHSPLNGCSPPASKRKRRDALKDYYNLEKKG